jgi:hypothetical protein
MLVDIIMGALVFKSGSEKLEGVPKSFFELQAKDIRGKAIPFSEYRGRKAILVVNVACK